MRWAQVCLLLVLGQVEEDGEEDVDLPNEVFVLGGDGTVDELRADLEASLLERAASPVDEDEAHPRELNVLLNQTVPKWRITNGEEIEQQWVINDLAFYSDPACKEWIDVGNAIVRTSTAGETFGGTRYLWDGDPTTTWSSQCTGKCIVPLPKSNVMRVRGEPSEDDCCMENEAFIELEGVTVIGCVQLHQHKFHTYMTRRVELQEYNHSGE
jgi:hypothetical protein